MTTYCRKLTHPVYLQIVASQLHLIENTVWLDQLPCPYTNSALILYPLRATLRILEKHGAISLVSPKESK